MSPLSNLADWLLYRSPAAAWLDSPFAGPTIFGASALVVASVVLSTRSWWPRAVSFLAMLLAVLALWQESLGLPRPLPPTALCVPMVVKGYIVQEPDVINLFLERQSSPGHIEFFYLPFDERFAVALQRAVAESLAEGGAVVLCGPDYEEEKSPWADGRKAPKDFPHRRPVPADPFKTPHP
jgi:hypothetical protein